MTRVDGMPPRLAIPRRFFPTAVARSSSARDDAAGGPGKHTRAVTHVHVHAPHALTEGPEESSRLPERMEHRLEFAAVLLLALTTLATAWCGYQAARWSGEQ